MSDNWLWLVLGIMGVATMVVEIRQRKAAGAVLMDLGRGTGRLLSLAVSGFLQVGLLLTEITVSHGSIWAMIASLAGLGCGFLTVATRRFQFREAGILRRYKLIRWERIAGCQLSAIGTLSLKLRDKDWMFVCDVPCERHAEVQKLLASRFPAVTAP
jgi:hypothetical protein